MVDGEGSVITDGMDAEDHANDSESSTNIESSEDTSGSQEGQTGEHDISSDGTQDSQDEKVKLTEKGTKLAEDPMQQANQLRANAEAKARQYEEFFSNPANVEAYLQDLKGGKPSASVESGQVSQMTDADIEQLAANVQTPEDIRNVLKSMTTLMKGEIQKVREEVQGITQSTRIKETNANVANEITQVQAKYPSLQSKLSDGSENPEFDKELDDTIGKLFLKMDFDPQNKVFRGQASLMEVADMVMKAAKVSESRGSRKAQTIIKDKRGGRVISGGVSTDNRGTDESKMTPSQTIADRIRRISKK